MKIETRIEPATEPSHEPPNPPEASQAALCPACAAVRAAGMHLGRMRCPARGAARLACEAARLGLMKARAAVPATASLAIPLSPARGPMRVSPQAVTVMTEAGPRTRGATRDGFHPVELVDAFDLMELQARRRDPEGRPLFSVLQVNAGREYARLSERVAAEGVRCTSVEALGQGSVGGGSGSWIDGVIARGRRLERMRAAIGRDVALGPKRRPRRRRGIQVEQGIHLEPGARSVTVRELVDAVCCEGVTLTDLMRRKGWSPQAQPREVLRAQLAGALNRLYGL